MAVLTALTLSASAAVTPLNLPHAWAETDGKAAYTEALGCTALLGKDYGSNPKLGFRDTGNNLIIQLASAPDQLTYDIKWNGSGTAAFTENVFGVLESVDGVDYTPVIVYNADNMLVNAQVQNEAYALKADTRYIQFVYTTKDVGNVALGNISITAGSASGIATPTVSIPSGQYYEPQSVTLECATEGASLYYTTDDTEPTAASTPYTDQPIEIKTTTTLKVVAVKDGNLSNVAAFVYTFPTEVADITAFNALADDAFCKIIGTLTVVFNDGDNSLYVEDESGSMLIYDFNIVKNTALVNGKTLTGIVGTRASYNGLPQMKSVVFVPEAGEGQEIQPEVVTAITAEQGHKYVKFESVEFDKEYDLSNKGTNAALVDGTVIRTNFKNLNLGKVEAGVKYHVAGFVSAYNGTPQLYPIAITPASETGVKEALAEKVRFDGKVLYNSDNRMLMVYNIAGVVVAQGTDNLDLSNLSDGIYLVRNGKNAMKIVKR